MFDPSVECVEGNVILEGRSSQAIWNRQRAKKYGGKKVLFPKKVTIPLLK
jgi:hypothetical protein